MTSLVRRGALVGLVTHLASFPIRVPILLGNQRFVPLFAVRVGEMLPRAFQVVLVVKTHLPMQET